MSQIKNTINQGRAEKKIDFLKLLLSISLKKSWLQSIVNSLKELLDLEYIELHTYVDNVSVSSGLKNENTQTITLSVDGCLKVFSKDDEIINEHLDLINQIQAALSIRSILVFNEQKENLNTSLKKINEILSGKEKLNEKIQLITKEISSALNTSRCQIKFFSKNTTSIYDTQNSYEYAKPGIIEALSVIPSYEEKIILEIKNGFFPLKEKIFSEHELHGQNNIERLLSVKYFCSVPLFLGINSLGVLIIHQCDFIKVLSSHEKHYLSEIALIISTLVSRELNSEKNENIFSKEYLSSDEFLRYLTHMQMESDLKKEPFSLILLDICGLNEINSKSGFIGGNLVLSQTERYLNRACHEKYKIAKYGNDEFVIILQGIDNKNIVDELDKIKNKLTNISVLGIGPVDYSFSYVTYPLHGKDIPEILNILEKAMDISKSRGKSQVCSGSEVKLNLKDFSIPSIILQRSNFKTGPDVMETINKQLATNGITSGFHADILDSVQSLALALDAKDSYTEGHSKRVSEYALLLAQKIGLDLQEQEQVRLGAIMHDIGKIGIPENILCKNGKLTKEEYEVMKNHPVIGARILKPIKPLEKVANLVLYHHENWDGTGYPQGFSKDQIPVGARIVSITDAYQAMTSDRPYRLGLPQEEAFRRLRIGKESQWDPELVELFIDLISC